MGFDVKIEVGEEANVLRIDPAGLANTFAGAELEFGNVLAEGAPNWLEFDCMDEVGAVSKPPFAFVTGTANGFEVEVGGAPKMTAGVFCHEFADSGIEGVPNMLEAVDGC